MNQDRIKLLRSYIEESPGEPFNRYALALELMNEEPEEASEILMKLHKDAPSYLPTYYQLAVLMIEQNRFEEAKIILENGILVGRQQNDHKTIRELKALLADLE